MCVQARFFLFLCRQDSSATPSAWHERRAAQGANSFERRCDAISRNAAGRDFSGYGAGQARRLGMTEAGVERAIEEYRRGKR